VTKSVTLKDTRYINTVLKLFKITWRAKKFIFVSTW